MATENKGVMVYLPKDVEEYITNFCTEYNITRKDKEGNIFPSLGTGVVTYLKSQILGENPGDILAKPSKALGNGLTRNEVLDLINEYVTSHSPSTGLTRDEVLDLVHESVTSTLPSLVPDNSGLIEAQATLDERVAGIEQQLNERFAVALPERVESPDIERSVATTQPEPEVSAAITGEMPEDTPTPKERKPKATAGKIPVDLLADLAQQKQAGNLSNQQAADAIKEAGYGDFDSSTVSKKLKRFLQP